MSEDSYNKNKDSASLGVPLYAKNLGMVTPLNQRIKKAEVNQKSNLWLWIGVVAGFCYGFGNLCVVKISHFGFYTRELILFGGLFQSIAFLIGRFIYIKSQTGHFWSWENSPFRDPKTDTFRWKAVFAVFLDAFIKVTAGWMVIISFKYALYAGINQGAITTIFALSAIYVAIISWFVFGEVLNRFHILGMILLVGCTILIVFSKSSSSGKVLKVFDQEVESVSALVPVGFALITTVLYSFRTIYVKLFVKELNFNSFDYMIYSYLLSGGIFVPFLLMDMYENGFIPEVVFLGTLSGVLNGFGAFFLFYATSVGIAGPAYSLKNIEPVTQAVFGFFFFGQELNYLQVIAITMGVLGSLVLTLGPYIFRDKKEVEEEKKAIEKSLAKKV
uniref:EamA domain-containing protein n=1 Tax=Euplotes harpa TaxID=151035 RepID=A0A7S3J7A7_9SPIT|mmetsp:Transcript_23841/g.27436  ORF Transcript_23841/g.27436 Transcript_23841/m.27436 type:complete len:388 (+) Transcript_23841:1-1164(+)